MCGFRPCVAGQIDPWVPDIGYGPRVNDPDARVCHLSRPYFQSML